MKFIKIIILTLFILSNAKAAEFKLQDDGKSVAMVGEITIGDTQKLLQLLSKNVTFVVVESVGGNTEEAMLLGRIIHDHQLDLTVNKICGSSCANYLFPAGKNKKLPAGSILGLHGTAQLSENVSEQDARKMLIAGGVAKKDLRVAIPSVIANFKKQAQLERAYAVFLGINPAFYTDYRKVVAASAKIQKRLEGVHAAPIWWPSSNRLRDCYNILHVSDIGRPTSLDQKMFEVTTNPSFILLGDNGLDNCRESRL